MINQNISDDIVKLLDNNIENIDDIMPEIAKGFYVKMIRTLIEDIVSNLKNENKRFDINLQISPYTDDNGEIKLEVHEGDYTAFLPAIATCWSDEMNLSEFAKDLKETILERSKD